MTAGRLLSSERPVEPHACCGTQLILFAKVPTLVPTKTRLRASLGEDTGRIENGFEAERIVDSSASVDCFSLALLSDTLEIALEAYVTNPRLLAVRPVFDPTISLQALEAIFRRNLPSAPSLAPLYEEDVHAQSAGDFAERFSAALDLLHDRQADRLGSIVIGSDAPHTLARNIVAAVGAVVEGCGALAPTEDGGFSLLALPRHVRSARINWRTVFDGEHGQCPMLREAFGEIGTDLRVLETGYDIDTVADVRRLIDQSRLTWDAHVAKNRENQLRHTIDIGKRLLSGYFAGTF